MRRSFQPVKRRAPGKGGGETHPKGGAAGEETHPEGWTTGDGGWREMSKPPEDGQVSTYTT